MASVLSTDNVSRLKAQRIDTPSQAPRTFCLSTDDPWRPVSVHSQDFPVPKRHDSLQRGSWVIPDCWHHCDENSLPVEQRDNEPPRIKAVHAREVEWVKAWIQ